MFGLSRKSLVGIAIVLILCVICYFMFFGERVECRFCGEDYFEKQGKEVELLGMTIPMCRDCYEEGMDELWGD